MWQTLGTTIGGLILSSPRLTLYVCGREVPKQVLHGEELLEISGLSIGVSDAVSSGGADD